MKTRLVSIVICICLLAGVSIAGAETEAAAEEEQNRLLYWAEQEFPEIVEITDRAQSSAGRNKYPATNDIVTIHQDGSYVVVVPDEHVQFASPQPFGWVYFTQDYAAQKEQNDSFAEQRSGQSMPEMMIHDGAHVLYWEKIDNVIAEFVVEDLIGIADMFYDFREMDREAAMTLTGELIGAGFRNFEIKLIGDFQYVIIRDLVSDYGLVFYATIVEGVPVFARVMFENSFNDVSSEFFESALADLSISAVSTRK